MCRCGTTFSGTIDKAMSLFAFTLEIPAQHEIPSTTGIPSAFPTACEIPRVTSIHSSKNVHVRHSKSRSK